jgi:hypothetical protein
VLDGFQSTEALVLGHQKGKGRLDGRMGALECKLRDGTRFKVRERERERERETRSASIPPPCPSYSVRA